MGSDANEKGFNFKRMVRVGLTEKVTFEKCVKDGEQRINSKPKRGSVQHKGAKVGGYLAFMSHKEATNGEWARRANRANGLRGAQRLDPGGVVGDFTHYGFYSEWWREASGYF